MGSPLKPVSRSRKTPYRLEAKSVSYMLSNQINDFKSLCFGSDPRRGSKLILKGVNSESRPGKLTAIAGPSGAGKTTLLEILAGRISACKVSGQVLVNHGSMDANQFRRTCGYASREDALFPSLSVRETLLYSAQLRLPGAEKRLLQEFQS
ncbi:hypothetical protein L6164_022646 [Bauhinia variegata]|uniref:Uncharacterized protein n=1 Tax=Bauhinia variegata TaxID=167791 RepID=A0ACB9MG04_BAUVA|nr:hypothetical protein L6164_022646 [Bauhinia variegata]